jgi:hypothetical protein
LVESALIEAVVDINLTPGSNFMMFIDKLSIMLLDISDEIYKQYDNTYPDVGGIHNKFDYLVSNIMPELVKAASRRKD